MASAVLLLVASIAGAGFDRETFIETMREVAREELEESDDISHFLSTTYTEILDQLHKRAEKSKGEGLD